MKTFKKLLKTGSLCVFLVFASCSSDDSDNGDDNGGQPGENHTYEIQLTNDNETIDLSGSFPNGTTPLALYVDEEESEVGAPVVTMQINDGEMAILGGFILNNNQQPLPLSFEAHGNGEGSVLNITPGGTGVPLVSSSGTATFSNFEVYGHESVPESLASFTLNFEGVFQDMQSNVTYQGSGTIVIQPIKF